MPQSGDVWLLGCPGSGRGGRRRQLRWVGRVRVPVTTTAQHDWRASG